MAEEIETGRHTDDSKQNEPVVDPDPRPAAGGGDPLRKWTVVVLAVCGLLLVWHLVLIDGFVTKAPNGPCVIVSSHGEMRAKRV